MPYLRVWMKWHWGCALLCKGHRHQVIQISEMQSTSHFSGSLFPSSRRLRQHHMANFIKGTQSHVLFTTVALVELVPGYVWWSEVLCHPHIRHGCYQVTGSHHQQWWLNTLPETLEVPLQMLATRVQAFIFPWQIYWNSVPFTVWFPSLFFCLLWDL